MASRWGKQGNSERLFILGSQIIADGDCSHEIQRGLLLGRKAMTNLDRIDAFELWCWRRLLRVPWTARRSNQSILKEINPDYSLEGLMLKLKLQYFGHLMQRTDPLEKKDPHPGKYWRQEEKGTTEDRWLDGISGAMDMSFRVSSGSWW